MFVRARALVAFALLLTAAVVVHGTRPTPSLPSEDAPVVLPFVLDGARVLTTIDARVLVSNGSADETPLVVERLDVLVDGLEIWSQPVGASLISDTRWHELNAAIERLPHELSHLHRERVFAPADAPEFAGVELEARWSEIQGTVASLRDEYATGAPRPFTEVAFPLALDQVFAPTDPPGTVRTLGLRVAWSRGPRSASTTTATTTLRRLQPPLAPPPTLKFTLADATIHAGDLHVHSCHGEAISACGITGNCAAESLQLSGSYSYSELKTQYQALGSDWFTATDHSYCIESSSHYNQIVSECAALTDASFLVVPDIELSSDEEGSQSGSDLGDVLCIGTTSANHMGAHGISSRKAGGTSGFLGFCDGLFSDALSGFSSNAAAIRADGGYPVVHHPQGSSFGWNSFASTNGIEAGQMHGVEIWNGATQSGQGGHVGDWVAWMLGGRILYGYGGSDTHDSAFDYGANHAVFLGEAFNTANLEAAVRGGRVFVSNGHVLVLEVVVDGLSLPMGTLQALAPSQPSTAVKVRAHYNFGSDTSTISMFRGRVGDSGETALCSSPPLTGTGVWECTDTLDVFARTWYRAYSTGGSSKTAYTNPVFFLPGNCAYAPYGIFAGGANLASLGSVSNPSIGSVNRIDLTNFNTSAPLAFLAASTVKIGAGVPFQGGFLLIGTNWPLTALVPLAAGVGAFDLAIPFDSTLVGASLHWQAAAGDGSQPGGLRFTNGLTMTICDLLQ